jgi:hypothetical protein
MLSCCQGHGRLAYINEVRRPQAHDQQTMPAALQDDFQLQSAAMGRLTMQSLATTV